MQPLPKETITCVCAQRAFLLQLCSVALMHVLEHPVQCGVEKPRRPAALRPESHQLRALSEARENCTQRKTKGQKLQSPGALLELW